MGWKEFPLWTKCSIAFLLVIFSIFFLFGTITAATNGWKCTGDCSNKGCRTSLSFCYLESPVSVLYLLPLTVTLILAYLLNLEENPIFGIIATFVSPVLFYLILGALIGIFLQKTKTIEKHKSSKKQK